MTEENQVNDKVPESNDTEPTAEQALTEAKQTAERYLVNWQRTQADFTNFKQRTEQEKEETIRYARAAVISSILPVLDDMERAFASLPADLADQKWVDGFRAIERKLRASLETQGLTAIKALGEPFDPRFHEAIKQDKGKEGIVIAEMQKGYIYQNRVLRPSLVIVGNGEEETANKES